MRVLDLFCGGGGFSYGFGQAGFDVVLGIDNDPRVQETYEANLDAEFLLADIREIDPQDIQNSYGPFDVIIGSPPCQLCSTSNPNYDPDSGLELMKLTVDIWRELATKHLVIENTHYVRKYVKKAFPDMRAVVLNAVNFGVPQRRRRLFFGYFPFPHPTHSRLLLEDIYGNPLAPWNPLSSILEKQISYGLLPSDRIERLRRSKEREGYSVVFPDPLDRPARTVLASISKMNQNTFVVDPDGHFRYLTLREIARLQGFPDSFLLFGSPTDVQRMIGNAVSPPVAYALAQAIKISQEQEMITQ